MKVFIRTHRLLPLATLVLLAALVAVSLVSPLMQVQWGGTIGGRALASGTWTIQGSGVTPNSLNGIACPSSSTCFAVGASGTILNTTNWGNTWTSQTVGTGNPNLNGVACLSTTNCYVVGAYVNGKGKIQVLVTTDGSTWSSQNTNIVISSLSGIACPGTSPITCFTVGAGGGILKTADGSTWSQLTNSNTNNLNGIACPSTTNCFAVGAGGTILTLASGTWTSQNVGTANLPGIACPSATICFAVGASGTILFNTTGSLTESGTTTSATPVTLNGANKTTTYALGLTVTDNRQNGAGWNITFSSTAFSCATCAQGGGSYSFSTASTINIQSVVCNNGASGTCTLPTTNGITYPLNISQGATAKFYNATAGTGTTTGTGSITITPTVTITIPANTFKGTYTSTLTIAVSSGP
jgi:hypothetical protein